MCVLPLDNEPLKSKEFLKLISQGGVLLNTIGCGAFVHWITFKIFGCALRHV